MTKIRRGLEMLSRTRLAYSERGLRNGSAWVLEKLASKVGTGGRQTELDAERTERMAAPPPVRAPRIALLTYRLRLGFGVDVVVAEQVEYFLARGYRVTLFVLETEGRYEDRFAHWLGSGQLEVKVVADVAEVVEGARTTDALVAIAHTPPFYSALDAFGPGCLRVFFDYGEPPPSLFPDREAREAVNRERERHAAAADLVVTISKFLRDSSLTGSAEVIWPGNDHLLKRRSDLDRLAGTFRARTGLGQRRLVLNVTRFSAAERLYKGVDQFAEVRRQLQVSSPSDDTAFVLLGKGDDADRSWAEENGLHAYTNVSDDFLVAAYLDADAYLSTSQWEGYNLGIAQALSFGLPCFASDRAAHPEFGIPVSNDPGQLATWISKVPPGAAWEARFARRIIRSAKSSMTRFERGILDRARDPTSRETFSGRHQLAPMRQTLPLPAEASARPQLSFLILNKDRPDLLSNCIRSVERECHVPFEILIGDTGSTDPGILELYGRTPHRVEYLGHYNFSRGNNLLARLASGEVLCLLNNDIELIACDFSHALGLARDRSVGSVGAYLCYPDFRIQHAGMRICPSPPYRGVPEHIDRFTPLDGYPALARDREVVCVTGAMLMIRTELYAELGGLDEDYEHEAQDADLGLKLLARSLRNVVSPALTAFHLESATRHQAEWTPDRQRLAETHGTFIEGQVYERQRQLGLA